jgi:MtN3 and saliva related transmembrane protein
VALPASSWLIGLLAGTLTTLSFVPQVVKACRTRSLADFSLSMLVTFTLGVALWVVYGLMAGGAPVVVANAVTLALALALVAMKLRFG